MTFVIGVLLEDVLKGDPGGDPVDPSLLVDGLTVEVAGRGDQGRWECAAVPGAFDELGSGGAGLGPGAWPGLPRVKAVTTAGGTREVVVPSGRGDPSRWWVGGRRSRGWRRSRTSLWWWCVVACCSSSCSGWGGCRGAVVAFADVPAGVGAGGAQAAGVGAHGGRVEGLRPTPPPPNSQGSTGSMPPQEACRAPAGLSHNTRKASEHATVRSHWHAWRGQDIDPAVSGGGWLRGCRGGRDRSHRTSVQAQGEAQPWTRLSFIDEVVDLQKQRQLGASATGSVQVLDRSPVCTHELANYLGRPVPHALTAEIERITAEEIYERQVLFVRNLGFCEPTSARRISFQESLVFEKIHEQSYRAFGFELIDIPVGDLADCVAAVNAVVSPGS